jgi:hypothetical protein
VPSQSSFCDTSLPVWRNINDFKARSDKTALNRVIEPQSEFRSVGMPRRSQSPPDWADRIRNYKIEVEKLPDSDPRKAPLLDSIKGMEECGRLIQAGPVGAVTPD